MKIWTALIQLAQTKRLSTLIIGLLASAKLITDALGLPFITDPEMNAIANAVASVVTVIAIFMTHSKSSGTSSSSSGGGGASSGSQASSGLAGDGATASASPANASPQQASDGYARPPGS
ncbi:hypothetical protein [Alicyclobacillus fructus]|uniref:hypothetical protein n=1 Tax=Alicyclobacillus fructus TaxID=2816082 RepID=UPI001A8CF82B|nr:hypothetical protein [Alicyclobacillus fructus]